MCWLLLLASLVAPGCVFSASEVTPAPDRDDAPEMGDMRQDAELPPPDQDLPDADPDDMSTPEDDMDAGMGDMAQDMEPDITLCRSIKEQCALWQLECGVSPDRFDECDANVQLSCGECPVDQKLACQANKCVSDCMPRTRDEICAQDFQCGRHTVSECGMDIEVDCASTCAEGTTCVSTGQCCDSEQSRLTQRAALINAGKCGMQPIMVCEQERMEPLGMTCAEYATLTMKPADFYQCFEGRCVCRPETDQQLCEAAGRDCGMLPTTTDRCGTPRSGISCVNQCTGLGVKCCPGRGVCVGSLTPCS